MPSPFFGELYLRSTRPFLDPKITAAELDYLEARLLELKLEGPVLDYGCGHGRHLGAGLRTGRTTFGMDRDHPSLCEALPIAPVVRGDFFAPPFRSGSLAGIWAWYNSVFTFDDPQIRALFSQLARLLKPGGLLLLHTLPREKLSNDPTSHFNGQLPDGSHLIEDVAFDEASGRDRGRRTLTLPDGRVLAADYFIRYFFKGELEALLEGVGFRTIFVHGALDASPLTGHSADLILGAQRG